MQPNGSVESRVRRRFAPDFTPKPQPGSTVNVPEKDPNEKSVDKVQLVASVAQVLATLVTIVVVITRQ